MSTLLHISASPAVPTATAPRWPPRGVHLDVTKTCSMGPFPSSGGFAAGAKLAVFAGGQPTPKQREEWQAARAVFERFADADTYLFSVPMWNGGVPNVLKQWIGTITQPAWPSVSTRPPATAPSCTARRPPLLTPAACTPSVRRLPSAATSTPPSSPTSSAIRSPRSDGHRAHRQLRSGPGRCPRVRRRRPGLLTRSGHYFSSGEFACWSNSSK